jgi:hypothetical protein
VKIVFMSGRRASILILKTTSTAQGAVIVERSSIQLQNVIDVERTGSANVKNVAKFCATRMQ